MKTLHCGVVLLLAMSACSDGVRMNLGTNDSGSDATIAATPDVAVPSIVGTWTGYVELSKFADGTDRIALTFAKMTEAVYAGTVVFGSRPAPPPPSDPKADYPPAFGSQDAGASSVGPPSLGA